MIRSTTLSLCIGLAVSSQAQLTITDSLDVTGIATLLQGLGVTVSNVTVNCPTNAMGHFNGSSELSITQGLVLTNGCAACAADSSVAFANGINNGGGDADLDMDLGTPGLTMDACALEFDCVPVGDTLLFNFSFGSEEYPEFVGSSFNDAFAIYITGPGFLVPTNVAAIPGGTLVSINNVNAGVNYTYFHDNQNPPGQYVAYDGFTTNLTAFAVVQPGETYHFKVVVADVADMVFDSGVFLEAFSFHSPLHANGITGSQHNAMRLFQQGDNLLLHVSAAAVQGQPVLILDATGSIVRQQRLSNAMTTMDISGLAKGIYFVKVLDSALAPERFVKN